MGRITQIAAVENATAIWEYDPSLPNNCVLGSLDVIAAIRMIMVKVRDYHRSPQSHSKSTPTHTHVPGYGFTQVWVQVFRVMRVSPRVVQICGSHG